MSAAHDSDTDIISIERLRPTPEAVAELAELLIPMGREMAILPLDPIKATKTGYAALADGFVYVARDVLTNEVVGSVAMIEAEWWYSSEKFLQDQWFFVRQDARLGNVAAGLMAAVKTEADSRGQKAFITTVNPGRRQKPSQIGRIATVLGYFPLGDRIRVA